MVYELHDAISQSAIHFVSENDVFLIETLVGNVIVRDFICMNNFTITAINSTLSIEIKIK